MQTDKYFLSDKVHVYLLCYRCSGFYTGCKCSTLTALLYSNRLCFIYIFFRVLYNLKRNIIFTTNIYVLNDS